MVMADEMHPGPLMPSVNPLLPAAMSVALPAETRLSMISLA
jgi:hypothetical protein